VKKVVSSATLPTYAYPDDAGLDLCAAEEAILDPGERCLIGTGISIELPQDSEAQIRPRSGLALKYGITVLNSPGTIDAGFRGELKVLLINLGKERVTVEIGCRIAQLVVAPILRVDVLEVVDLSNTFRGHKGFGSTR
jgi:dUTP pyrophosphatase